MSHCELITDNGILQLSSSPCGHERLQVLELDNCLLITDVTLEYLENCHNLERIELYDCQQVTRAGIKRIRVRVWCLGQVGKVGTLEPSILLEALGTLRMRQAREGGQQPKYCSVRGCEELNAAVLTQAFPPQAHLPHVKVHAYFAPVTPPPSVGGSGQRLCRCCIIL